MCRSRILHTLVAAMLVALSAGLSDAQAEGGGGWGARAVRATAALATSGPADDIRPSVGSTADPKADAPRAAAKAKGLVGTWRVHIPQSAGGLPPFNAYQTFHGDGTITEVSDLLTTQTESPAHGVWTGKRSDYQFTFELFVFDPETKQPAGRVRVRGTIRLAQDGESFTADSVVDFITPDDSVVEAVDSGPFTGSRVEVVPVIGT
jgi:hypothetical protein